MEIEKINLIKSVRETTKASLKDCQIALENSEWNLEKAIDWLKTKSLTITNSSAKTAEGIVQYAKLVNGNTFGMIEFLCETDFCAKSEEFSKQTERYLSEWFQNKQQSKETLQSEIKFLVKENVKVGRSCRVVLDNLDTEKCFIYCHSNKKIGVLLQLSVPSFNPKNSKNDLVFDLGNNLAMHIAATKPLAISSNQLDKEIVEKQKQIFLQQIKDSGKDSKFADKMLEGKLNKWYKEVCLLDQEAIWQPKTSIKSLLDEVGLKIGSLVLIVDWERFEIGE